MVSCHRLKSDIEGKLRKVKITVHVMTIKNNIIESCNSYWLIVVKIIRSRNNGIKNDRLWKIERPIMTIEEWGTEYTVFVRKG